MLPWLDLLSPSVIQWSVRFNCHTSVCGCLCHIHERFITYARHEGWQRQKKDTKKAQHKIERNRKKNDTKTKQLKQKWYDTLALSLSLSLSEFECGVSELTQWNFFNINWPIQAIRIGGRCHCYDSRQNNGKHNTPHHSVGLVNDGANKREFTLFLFFAVVVDVRVDANALTHRNFCFCISLFFCFLSFFVVVCMLRYCHFSQRWVVLIIQCYSNIRWWYITVTWQTLLSHGLEGAKATMEWGGLLVCSL